MVDFAVLDGSNVMKIRVEYTAQIKQAAGVAGEELEVPPECTLQQLVERLGEKHGESLRSLLINGEGNVHPSLLLFVGDQQVRGSEPVPLSDGECVSFLSPVSGG